MVHIPAPVFVAALAIVPSLAAPVAQQQSQFARDPESEEFDARATGTGTGRLRRFGHIAGEIFTGINTAATIATLIPQVQPQQRDIADLEGREPINFRTAGHYAGKVFDGVGTVATIMSLIPEIQHEVLNERDYDMRFDLEAREPGTAWIVAGKSATALISGIGLGTALAPLFKKHPEPETQEIEARGPATRRSKREFNEMELRDIEEFDAREPINPGLTIKDAGAIFGKLSPYVDFLIPAAGASGVGLGIDAGLNKRDISSNNFETRAYDDKDLFERDYDYGTRALDELD